MRRNISDELMKNTRCRRYGVNADSRIGDEKVLKHVHHCILREELTNPIKFYYFKML